MSAKIGTTEDDAEVDPYTYVHAKGSNGEPGVETPCGLRATFAKTLATTPEDDRVTCPDCLAALHIDTDDTDDQE